MRREHPEVHDRNGDTPYPEKLQEATPHDGGRSPRPVGHSEAAPPPAGNEHRQPPEEVAALRGLLASREVEASRLRSELAAMAEDNRRLSQRQVDLERQRASLARLHVATQQLHASQERHAVLGAIEEIAAALIGCEEVAVYALDREAGILVRIAAIGLDQSFLLRVPVGEGVIGRTAASGVQYVREGEPDPGTPAADSEVTACIPLKLAGVVTGVIALFHLLPHKLGLEAADFELFDLLSSHAATALYCAALQADAAVVRP